MVREIERDVNVSAEGVLPLILTEKAVGDNLRTYVRGNLFLRVLEEVELPDVRLVAPGRAPVWAGG